ncbi:hypothetical protein LXL04_002130 [Taraxacum kok-saghyz]
MLTAKIYSFHSFTAALSPNFLTSSPLRLYRRIAFSSQSPIHLSSGRRSRSLAGAGLNLFSSLLSDRHSSAIESQRSSLVAGAGLNLSDRHSSANRDHSESPTSNLLRPRFFTPCDLEARLEARYPVLSKMARDVLAIPVSTVASESAFSTGGRVLDSFRTSLTPRMVEALVCTQDWVRDCHDPINVDDILLEIEKLEEEGLKDLTVDQPTIIIDETVDELADNIRVFLFNFRILNITIRIRIRNFGYPEIRISEISDSYSDSNIQYPKISDIRISDIRNFGYPHMPSPTHRHPFPTCILVVKKRLV